MVATRRSCASCASRPRAERRSRGSLSFAAVAASLLSCLSLQTVYAFDAGRAPFSVRVGGDLVVPYDVFALYVLPGETLELAVVAADRAGYELDAAAGTITAAGPAAWRWQAPSEPGIAVLTIRSEAGAMRLNGVVLVPAHEVEHSRLGDYRIGDYPPPLDGNPVYARPDGFIRLDETTADLQVSPHFTLAQFPSKQSTASPRYLVLREQLLLKLELLLERVNAHGVQAETFTIMSGFRTPFYNAAIGNVPHSRHVFGGAADIFIDENPRDGVMDDVDGNDVLDHGDAQWLFAHAEDLFATPSRTALRGGMGVYGSTAAHGPFLHIDARGARARWGLLPARVKGVAAR